MEIKHQLVKNSGLKPQSVFEFLSTIKNAFVFCELKQVDYTKSIFEVLKLDMKFEGHISWHKAKNNFYK